MTRSDKLSQLTKGHRQKLDVMARYALENDLNPGDVYPHFAQKWRRSELYLRRRYTAQMIYERMLMLTQKNLKQPA